MNPISRIINSTDLPVMKSFKYKTSATIQARDILKFSLNKQTALVLILLLTVWLGIDEAYAQVQGDPNQTILETLIKWTPLMFFGPPNEFGGFVLNITVSFIAMAMGTFMGLWVGIGQVSPNNIIRRSSWLITQLFRNSPWLVLLFYFMLLLPYTVEIAGTRYDISGWTKATFALSLPIMANLAEIVRGAINSIPTGQWESA